MAGITERNKLKNDLAGIGYSLKYIDEWQPKTRMYRHKASYNVNGAMMEGVGTYIDNVPGNPDYVMKKSRIGLFVFPPSDTCECRWCVERMNGAPQEEPEQEAEDPEPTFSGTASEVLEQMGSTRKGRKMGPHFQSDS